MPSENDPCIIHLSEDFIIDVIANDHHLFLYQLNWLPIYILYIFSTDATDLLGPFWLSFLFYHVA